MRSQRFPSYVRTDLWWREGDKVSHGCNGHLAIFSCRYPRNVPPRRERPTADGAAEAPFSALADLALANQEVEDVLASMTARPLAKPAWKRHVTLVSVAHDF